MAQEPIVKDTVTLANSEIKKIADRVAMSVILSGQKVSVADTLTTKAGSFEAILQSRLKTFKPEKRKDIKQRIEPIVKASTAVRTALYGELGKIDIMKVDSVEDAVKKMGPVKIDRKVLGLWTKPPGASLTAAEVKKMEARPIDILGSHNITSVDAITGGGRVIDHRGGMVNDDIIVGGLQVRPVTNKLGLYITSVKCVDETNPEWAGDDEISMAATTVDETGDTSMIPEFVVGNSFDDGDVKRYNPHKQLYAFNMNEGGENWPKSYYFTLIIAEKDNGGLASFLQKLWAKVAEQVRAAIAAAVGAAAGSVLGPLGAVIGAAVGYAVMKIVEWFINSWNDDIFPPATISCTMASFNTRWKDSSGRFRSTVSNIRRAHFYGFGGHYYVEYYWKVFA